VRQKVKPHFLPVQSAKKGKHGSPFFAVKATQPATYLHDPVGAHAVRPCNRADRAGFAPGLHGLKPGFAWFQTPNQPGKKWFFTF
jgi:hypothetical protein